MGLNLAQAAMLEGKSVTYLPAYGAEVRGGTANCTIAISDEEIASPVASSPEFFSIAFHFSKTSSVLCWLATKLHAPIHNVSLTSSGDLPPKHRIGKKGVIIRKIQNEIR